MAIHSYHLNNNKHYLFSTFQSSLAIITPTQGPPPKRWATRVSTTRTQHYQLEASLIELYTPPYGLKPRRQQSTTDQRHTGHKVPRTALGITIHHIEVHTQLCDLQPRISLHIEGPHHTPPVENTPLAMPAPDRGNSPAHSELQTSNGRTLPRMY